VVARGWDAEAGRPPGAKLRLYELPGTDPSWAGWTTSV